MKVEIDGSGIKFKKEKEARFISNPVEKSGYLVM